ncbi:hypothetical protein KJ359_001730 [Pestalotiopsis sp. 9143b]|nr:hypothetical protein KJ359_001730 [Pestalotiopsis sp. 9143b]
MIADVLSNNRRLQQDYQKPDPSADRLYIPTYTYAGDKDKECTAMCDATHLVERPKRSEEQDSPTVHYGTIASANQLMKDANLRDKLSAENNVLCFEMEAAGLMNHFPCLVIRGICDYSDTHKNKVWQGYAAMAAAAYAKDLLRNIAPNKVEAERSQAYTTWKTGGSSFLWLHGIPGCGKTILTSTVIEDLQKSQSHAQTLLYFYFDFTDSRKQSFENTLRSLVWQIYYQNKVARKHLDSLYSSACQNGKVQPSFDSLRKVFTEMIGNLGEVWIVLDALDECTPRGDLLAWLRSVNQDLSVQVKMHLLVTSRPEQDIKSAIKRYACDEQIIAIRDDLLKGDIRNYVQARVREHEGLSRWRGYQEIQDKIEASLLEKANGM